MSLGDLFRDTFSPYEIAVIGRVISLILVAAAMIIWFPHPTRVTPLAGGIGAILFLLAPMAGLLWEEFSLCPTCGKSPFAKEKGETGYMLRFRRHHWPERQCSECGTALDIRP